MSKDSNLVVEFRKIPSLKFLYEVSEDGRIVRNVKSKHQLAMEYDWGGYYRVSPVFEGKQIHKFVHVLVAECWLGPKPEGMECDHIDNDRHNNHYTNLRYVTKQENLGKRVFTEEGKQRNGEITKNRWLSYTPEEQQDYIKPMREARLLPENVEKQRQAIVASLGHPVSISKDGVTTYFDSKSQCAHFIAEAEGCPFGTIEYYLCKRRKYIHGFYVEYER